MFSTLKKIREKGILGINRRNAHYTRLHNPRRFYPIVDNKLKTKQVVLASGLATPPLYHTVSTEYEIRHLQEKLISLKDFVVKPARGSGGKGIMVIAGRMHHYYRLIDGTLIDQHALNYHVANILSGMYSLGGQRDQVIVEYRVIFDPIFEAISYQGVPDIRIIVYKGIPVMAMVRLPTRMSNGKANLHQGAVGAGINLASGETLGGVWRDLTVLEHPDTGERIQGLHIPNWNRLLELGAGCYELSNLGYLGVDLVLDRDKGPLILELNARPGLSIQIANHAGLRPRLEAVESQRQLIPTVLERVRFAQKQFANS